MNFKTHVMGGVLAGATSLASISNVIEVGDNSASVVASVYMASAVIGSIFPDIDHKGSYISKRVKAVSFFISRLLKHRGITHAPIVSIFMMGVLLVVGRFFFFSDLLNVGIIGFLIGALSHILLDSMTKGGVPLLYPFNKKKFSLMGFPTGGVAETLIFVGLVLGSVYVVVTKDVFDFTSVYELVKK